MTTKKTPVKKSTKKKSAVKKTPAKTTAAERRVAIAIDTIKWLGTKAIKMKPGTYFQLPRKAIKNLNHNHKLDVALATVKTPCQVCALGGMFYSMVRRFDKVPLSICNTVWEKGDMYADGVGHADIYIELSKYFDGHQLSLIESAFEKRDMVEFDEYDGIEREFVTEGLEISDLIDWAINFARKKNAADRLRAIMTNIIENKGTFKP
jgi:hypothetical protein